MSIRLSSLSIVAVSGAVGIAGVASVATATPVPANIQSGLVGFFDASQAYSDTAETAPQTAAGGTVAALKNQGTFAPAATDAFQATTANQPTLVPGLNGQNAIRFNGTSNFLASALSTDDLGSAGYTLFVVAKANGVDGNSSVIRFQTASDGSAYVVFPYTGVPKNDTTGSFIQSGQNNPYYNGVSDGGLSDGSYHEGTAILVASTRPMGCRPTRTGRRRRFARATARQFRQGSPSRSARTPPLERSASSRMRMSGRSSSTTRR